MSFNAEQLFDSSQLFESSRWLVIGMPISQRFLAAVTTLSTPLRPVRVDVDRISWVVSRQLAGRPLHDV